MWAFKQSGKHAPGDGTVLKESWILPIAKKELDFATNAMKDSAVTNYEAEKRYVLDYHNHLFTAFRPKVCVCCCPALHQHIIHGYLNG
jgi:hypothetical protein